MRRERLPQPHPIGRQVTREEGVILREAGAGAERLLPDRAGEPLGELDERGPGVGIVRPRPDDERRRSRRRRGASASSATAVLVRRRARARRGAAAAARAGSLASAAQSSIGTITTAGPRPVAASWWARAIAPGHVLGAHGLVDPDRVVAREAVQPAGEERLGREMTPILLADDDDERRPVDARRRERADGVAEPGRRVQDRERRLAAADRPACRHADDRALVQPEHEAEVVGRSVRKRDLGRPRDSRTAS